MKGVEDKKLTEVVTEWSKVKNFNEVVAELVQREKETY